MEEGMKESGKMILDLGEVLNSTLMAILMLVFFNLEKHMATASTSGLMVKNMMANGLKE